MSKGHDSTPNLSVPEVDTTQSALPFLNPIQNNIFQKPQSMPFLAQHFNVFMKRKMSGMDNTNLPSESQNPPEKFVNPYAKPGATIVSTAATYRTAKRLDTATSFSGMGKPTNGPEFNAKVSAGMFGFVARLFARQGARVLFNDNFPVLIGAETIINASMGTYILHKGIGIPLTVSSVAKGAINSSPLVAAQSVVFLGSARLYDKIFSNDGSLVDQAKKTGFVSVIDTVVNLIPGIVTSEIQKGKTLKEVFQEFNAKPEDLLLRIKRALPARSLMCFFGAGTFLGTLELTKMLNTPDVQQFIEKSIDSVPKIPEDMKKSGWYNSQSHYEPADTAILNGVKGLTELGKTAGNHVGRYLSEMTVSKEAERFASAL